jgi:hypothetical protein
MAEAAGGGGFIMNVLTLRVLVVVVAGVATACDKLPTAPTPAVNPTSAAGSPLDDRTAREAGEVASVRSVDAERLEIDIATSGGIVKVTIVRPYDEGVHDVIVDGNSVCLQDGAGCGPGQSKDGQLRPQLAVAPIVLWAIRVYATWDFFRGCARPLWTDFRAQGIQGITQSTTENCILAGAAEAAGGVLGTYLRGVGVTRLRGAIKESVGSRLTWQQLRNAMNKRNFRDVVQIVTALAEEFFQRVYDGIYQAIQRL